MPGGKEKAAPAPGQEVANARQQLRVLHESLLKNKPAYTSTSSAKLGEALDDCNALYEVGKEDARYKAIDASFLSTTSVLGADMAQNLDKVTPEKFVNRLKAQHGFTRATGPGKIKWKQLADAVLEAGIFEHVPAPTFLVGKFEAPAKKQRADREKKAKEGPSGPMETASSVNVDDLQENSKDKAQVVRIRTLLEAVKRGCADSAAQGQPKRVNVFHVLLNPDSFSQTVENFFDLAFVTKQGNIKLFVEAGTPYLQRAKAPKAEDYKTTGLFYKQNILKLDVPTWRALSAKWCGGGQPSYLVARDPRAPTADAGEQREDGEDDDDDEEDADEDADEDELVGGAAPSQSSGKRPRAS